MVPVCAGDEFAEAGAGADTDPDALAEAEAAAEAVLFALAVSLGGGVLLTQLVLALAVGLAVVLGLGLAVAVAVALAVIVAVGLPLGLAVAVALPVGLPLPLIGMIGDPDGVADGVAGGVDRVVVGFGELVLGSGLTEGDGEAGGHDTTGVGSWFPAGVVATAAVALPSGLPGPPATAGLAALAAWRPSRTPDMEVLMAWRSGGTAARTTPTAKTAQPSAMAGLSKSSRQFLGDRAAWRA